MVSINTCGLLCLVLCCSAAAAVSSSGFLLASSTAQLSDSVSVIVMGGNISASASDVLSMQLSSGDCANVTVINNTAVICIYGTPPFPLGRESPLPLLATNFSVNGVPLTLYNVSKTGVWTESSFIVVTTMVRPPNVTDGAADDGRNTGPTTIYIIGKYFTALDGHLNVSVRAPYSPELRCDVSYASDTQIECKVPSPQDLLLSAGPLNVSVTIQGTVSTGFVPLGWDFPPFINELSVDSVAAAVDADTMTFVIYGAHFASDVAAVSVNISQADRVPLHIEVPCEVSSASVTQVACTMPRNFTSDWVAGTLRGLVQIRTPDSGIYASRPSPIAVLRPSISRTITPFNVALGDTTPTLITISGTGFATDPANALVTLRRDDFTLANISCATVSATANAISCFVPGGTVAGRYEVYLQVIANVTLDQYDTKIVLNASLETAAWTTAIDLLPTVIPTGPLLNMDLVPPEGLNWTLNGAGFSPVLLENHVQMSLGSAVFGCLVQTVTFRSIVCLIRKEYLQRGELVASVKVRAVTSQPVRLANVVLSTTFPPPKTADVTGGVNGGVVAAVVLVVFAVVFVAVLFGWLFRKQIREKFAQLVPKKPQAPDEYAPHVDRIPMSEVLAALTPEGEPVETEPGEASDAAGVRSAKEGEEEKGDDEISSSESAAESSAKEAADDE